ncbi:hypothetical protein RvY_14445 [Ramazzottius varieornatus]|uniref:Uncharacterized protein n=1 Tax=Ramazzottius varieornatus TaxID=947166 RepID=A0A1D1VWE4_RAMVA|nr:hypothetical protein RvY_14445 [Ramazzottius varieornatus]
MALTVSDVLKGAKQMTSSMRQRDTGLESSRRAARSALARMEAGLECNDGSEKMTGSELDNALSHPLPDLILGVPHYRALVEDNQRLYNVVTEQQLTLDLIMQKYRQAVASTTTISDGLIEAKENLDHHEAQLGRIIHDKGITLAVIHQSVWDDNEADAGIVERAAHLVLENATLRELTNISLKMNGRAALSLAAEEKGVQTEKENQEKSSSNDSGNSQKLTAIPPTVPAFAGYASDFHTSNLLASEVKAPSTFTPSRISNMEIR